MNASSLQEKKNNKGEDERKLGGPDDLAGSGWGGIFNWIEGKEINLCGRESSSGRGESSRERGQRRRIRGLEKKKARRRFEG